MGSLLIAGTRQGQDQTEKVNGNKQEKQKEAQMEFLMALFIYSGIFISITPEDQT